MTLCCDSCVSAVFQLCFSCVSAVIYFINSGSCNSVHLKVALEAARLDVKLDILVKL